MDNTISDSELGKIVELGKNLISTILDGGPIDLIEQLVRKEEAPLWYQDDEEGISALHAAVYVQDQEIVKLLLKEGAVWNAVDRLNNTAGDIALSFNNEQIYTLIRDHGLRSELVLGLLASKSNPEPNSSSLILKHPDSTAAASTEAFLSSRLTFITDENGQEICLVKAGEDEVGVMMGWEQEIMEVTVNSLCDSHPNLDGLRVLNIGHGLGIIDTLFQNLSTPPALHCIVEPHPDVLQHMKERGWYDKQGVKILEGKWQDSIEELINFGGFDVVYTDTFSEDYRDLRDFFEHLPDLLSGPESRFSFFNGLGATNHLFYDVYTRLSELHLADIGMDINWQDVHVNERSEEDRWGTTRQYFTLPVYRLPVGAMRDFS